MPMNDTVDEELFSYDVFNDVLAGMSRMLLLLESDRIEEITDEEKLICDKVKLIFSTKDDFDKQELVEFCHKYQVAHNKIINQITELKSSIEKHQRDKKITASKIFTYKKMNNLKY